MVDEATVQTTDRDREGGAIRAVPPYEMDRQRPGVQRYDKYRASQATEINFTEINFTEINFTEINHR
jgi:hypothetical protein